jgi:mannose-6-phosphate isomerase-like protein (cupin superfamily)
MEIEGNRQTVRKHDVIFIPPGVPHSTRQVREAARFISTQLGFHEKKAARAA